MNHIDLNNKTIIVTGAAGFIGANLVKRLLTDVPKATIIGIDSVNDYYDVRLKEYRLDELSKYDRFIFIKGNIADKELIESVFEKYKPDVVVNLVNGNVAIDFWDGKAISADTSVKNNKINVNASISWGNIICKYGYKRGWLDTGHANKHFLDVPIWGDPKDMSLETIEGATSQIKHLIQEFSKSFAPAM